MSTQTFQRLSDNQKIHAVFSEMNPLQSTIDMNKQFTIIEQLSDGGNEKARVYIAERISGEKCVLKMVTLDKSEQKYVERAYRSNSRKGLQGNHKFLRYSCWSELNLLRNARQALLKQASPCFPYIYSSHYVESLNQITFPIKNQNEEPQLVYCIEYLSRMTLRQWLHTQIINSRYWHKEVEKAIAIFKTQFLVLFFHIFAALNVLQDLGGFLHNDLHLDNILIVQSKECCENFVYVIHGKIFTVPNILGECLRQLPVICDFGAASDAKEMQNVSFQDHFRQTHRCAYHYTRILEETCYFTPFCDVLRILNDMQCELETQPHATSLQRAFEPFAKLRNELQKQFTNRCFKNFSFVDCLIYSMYLESKMPSGDFIVFDCDKIVSNK